MGDGWDFVAAAAFVASVVGAVNPGAAGGVADFAGCALLASFVDGEVPGALVESIPVVVASLAASLVVGLASESGGVGGIDGIEVASCAGG